MKLKGIDHQTFGAGGDLCTGIVLVFVILLSNGEESVNHTAIINNELVDAGAGRCRVKLKDRRDETHDYNTHLQLLSCKLQKLTYE